MIYDSVMAGVSVFYKADSSGYWYVEIWTVENVGYSYFLSVSIS